MTDPVPPTSVTLSTRGSRTATAYTKAVLAYAILSILSVQTNASALTTSIALPSPIRSTVHIPTGAIAVVAKRAHLERAQTQPVRNTSRLLVNPTAAAAALLLALLALAKIPGACAIRHRETG